MTVYFWKPFEENGFLSNWYPSPFTIESLNITFANNEQYMMYCKAILFKDKEIAERIMKTNNPNEIRSLGRIVVNFKPKVWDEKCMTIVENGCYLKFTQNKDLKKKLLETGNKKLVEASPYDKKWGVGLNKINAIKIEEDKWPGENRLGICLMNIRDKLNQN